MADPLQVVVTRSGRIESQHRVHVAVVDVNGAVVAAAGDLHSLTCWRSAAKIFQASVAVDTGAADAFNFDDRALALACGSHSGEAAHLEVAAGMLARCGCTEAHLACGPHPSLSARVRRAHLRVGTTLSALHNNCSGKHAAMLATAQHLGSPSDAVVAVDGYERPDHPVQRAILQRVSAVSGVAVDDVGLATDGCRAVSFYLPLQAMARAWAHAGVDDGTFARLRKAMWQHPVLVAGEGRACTDFLAAGAEGERLLVKIGAEGVYCAALPQAGLGIALKVESGDARIAPIALAGILRDLDGDLHLPHAAWATLAAPPVKDTRGDVVGETRLQTHLQRV